MTEATTSTQKSAAQYSGLADESLVSSIVDVFYQSLLDDYRINRYFAGRPLAEQTKPLKLLINALLNRSQFTDKDVWELAGDFFTAAFARGNAKPSMVNNRDFAFLEAFVTGDLVNAGKPSELVLLCPAHSHFIRLQPNDDIYDVTLENLANTLKQLNIAEPVAAKIMAFAESGRDGILGRGKELYNDGDMDTHYRSHG